MLLRILPKTKNMIEFTSYKEFRTIKHAMDVPSIAKGDYESGWTYDANG